MKKFLFLLLFATIGSTVSGQVQNLATSRTQVADSLKKADREINHKFLNKGNTLLNMRGSIPESLLIERPKQAKKPNEEGAGQEKLVVNTLLFTGKLQDHLSRPFMIYSDTLNLKAKD